MEATAFIPVRGGSKRIPNKNIIPFQGKPLIVRTIEQAISSGIFKEIVVSTDSIEISRIASTYEVKLSHRPQSLATDKAVLLDVIRDYIISNNLSEDVAIGVLLVTAPLRTHKDIRAAYDIFDKSDKKGAVVSVCKDSNPIHLAWVYDGDKLSPIFPDQYKKNKSKNERMFTYYFNDAIIFDSVANFKKPDRNLFGENPIPYIMPPERSVYIDYEYQLKIARCLAEEEE